MSYFRLYNGMKNIQAYINSGILELYVSGCTTAAETADVLQMAATYPQIAAEIDTLSSLLQTYAVENGIMPHLALKPFLMATIDYSERLKQGEPMAFPPELQQHSTIADYSEWLDKPAMKPPAVMPDMFAKIIGYTPQMTTAIVWIKEMAPQEVHDDEIEKFLVIEGTCDITIGDTIHQLAAGDMLSIPLYQNHVVKVTSAIACKVILQRVAA